MSQKEVDRLAVVQRVVLKQLSQQDAAKQLGLSSRQLRNLQKTYLADGAEGLISKRRGKPSKNQLPRSLREEAIAQVKAHYADFGPTLAQEKLEERHNLKLSVESLRKLMIAEGIWRGKRRRVAHIHPQRARRSCLGELVQIDGSTHDWFEGRREQCCLLVFIDDATSRIMQLYFVEVESTEGYFTATTGYLDTHGRPLGFYSDKHGIFRVNMPEAEKSTGETQFGRAMRELDIELICANSPQAKGRVEKANGTLQDRLIKEMRLNSISDIPAANAFLPQFIEDYNKRFAKEPANATNVHRAMLPDEGTLKLLFSQQHQRKISKNLEVSYNNMIYQIQSIKPSYTMRGASVTVCDRANEITLLYKGKTLPYKIFDKHNTPTKIYDSKQISLPTPLIINKPKPTHPWRRYEQVRLSKQASSIGVSR